MAQWFLVLLFFIDVTFGIRALQLKFIPQAQAQIVSPLPLSPVIDDPSVLVSSSSGMIKRPQGESNPIKDYIYTKPHADIIWRLYGLESSYGKFDSCKGQGYNGFGFATWTNHLTCYSSPTKVVDIVSAWLDSHLDKYTLARTLCIYNRGINENNCEYAKNFLNL